MPPPTGGGGAGKLPPGGIGLGGPFPIGGGGGGIPLGGFPIDAGGGGGGACCGGGGGTPGADVPLVAAADAGLLASGGFTLKYNCNCNIVTSCQKQEKRRGNFIYTPTNLKYKVVKISNIPNSLKTIFINDHFTHKF